MTIYKVVVFALLVTFFASCSTSYQLLETKPTSAGFTGSKDLCFENDTIKICYSFWAEKGILNYSIYNKLNIPIYIDWKKSSFIKNGDKLDFWVDETSTNSFTSSNLALFYGYYFNTLGQASSSSKSIKPQRVVFIAPQSTITKVQFYLFPAGTERLPTTAQKGTLLNPETNRNIPVKYIDYTKDNSPLVFRNFLTISTSENFEKEIYINNSFYITKVSQLKGDYLLKRMTTENSKTFWKESPFKKPSSFYIKVK